MLNEIILRIAHRIYQRRKQVAQPLMRWFRDKSQLCRELEVQAIRDFIESEKGDSEQERTKRIADDAAWMAALSAETPPASPCSTSSSCGVHAASEADRQEEEEKAGLAVDGEKAEEKRAQVCASTCLPMVFEVSVR